jgi:hypothetical protein
MLSHGGARQCRALRHGAYFTGGSGARPVLAQAERGGAIFAAAILELVPIESKRTLFYF